MCVPNVAKRKVGTKIKKVKKTRKRIRNKSER